MKARATTILAAVVVLLGVLSAAHSSAKPYSKTIVDVSWPNCKTAPAELYGAGIIGVNGGLDFRPNPCLATETSWFVNYALYINTGYPGSNSARKFPSLPKRCGHSDKQCLAYNYGFNATQYAIRYADLQDAHATQWWLDVETDNSWTDNFLVNRASLRGAAAAVRQNVLFSTVGIYSSPEQWKIITGSWQNGLPAWLATGSSNKSVAAKACRGRAFTGGATWLSQYTQGLDKNLPCLGLL
jgi:hypothetical protein